MIAVQVFCLLSLLLVVGKVLRVCLPPLQKLYLPSSVVGGIAGLIAIQLFPGLVDREIVAVAGKLPGFLINVVFATLFLGMATPKVGELVKLAFPQLCFGQILAWGQYVLGIGLTGFVLVPLFGIHPAFGNLLEIGFEGGHGTVGGMTQVFESNHWSEGVALGYTVATVGMILAIIVGMILVNWAHRKGYVAHVVSFSQQNKLHRMGVYHRDEMPSAGRQTVLSDSIDSLAWHAAVIGISILIGYFMLKGLQKLEITLLPGVRTRVFSGFPLFPLCMIGGVLTQAVLHSVKGDYLIDHGQMQRISGAALDFLVVSAIATIQLSVVADNAVPLLILMSAGVVWSVVLTVFLAPKLFKRDWFACAIAEFGQGLGVTATGLMLLRTVDPENRTVAASSFGYKQLIHEPFMGGGLWTAFALTLVFTVGWLPVWGFCTAMLIVWGIVAVFLCRRK